MGNQDKETGNAVSKDEYYRYTLVSFGMNRWQVWHGEVASREEISTTLFGRVCLLDADRAVLVTKVSGNGLLTSLAASSLDLITVGTEEETNLENTRNGLDLVGESSDLPLTILARTVLAVLDVILGEEGFKGSVDDVEALVCLDGTGLCKGVFTKYGLDGSNELELAHNGGMGDGGDFNGY